MKKTILVLLAALAPCKVMAQGVDDPYRQDQKEAQAERFIYLSERASNRVRWLYFAVACGVVPERGYILKLEDDYIDEPTRYGLEHGLTDLDQMLERKNKAETDGTALAEKPIRCKFWHQHPEYVARLRAAVGIMD